jgi:Domain of unknown function (DUF4178)
MVVRHDVKLESIGQMAELPPDLSPLQVGTNGEFDGLAFTLIGRVRLAYDEGSWNEWCALFGDGRYGWVAETQGFFMVSFESAAPEGFPAADTLTADRVLEVEGQRYQVVDCKETVCLGSEGELPFSAPVGRKAASVDLAGADSRFAGVETAEGITRIFVGRYAHFDELKFTKLRPVPGWSEDVIEPVHHQTTALNCPKCGATVSLRAAGFSMSAKCDSCGSLLDTATPDLQIISQVEQRQRLKPVIPLGRRGKLFEVNYEVIGFQHVKDEYSGWHEYLLFNPWQGFAWLVTYGGHWTFVRRLFTPPRVSESGVFKHVAHAKLNDETYRIFAVSSASTDYVVGEFYWKVSLGMVANVTDFVCPPWILSREAYPGLREQTWSQGEYVEPKAIQEAFGLEQELAEPTGVYLNQPNLYLAKARQLGWLVPLLVLVMLGVQIVSARRAANQQVLSGAYLYHAGPTNPVAVTAAFELPRGNQALDFILNAPVDNNWLEVGIDLVNAESQQEVSSFEQGIEYYHGYDDGYWSEGNQTQHHLLPAIPPGKYRLAIEASADPAIREMPFTVTVVRDVMVWSNFWIAVSLALVYPLYCWLRAYNFERARWLDSDYSPYSSGGND